MGWREKLQELGLELPQVNPPAAHYSPLVKEGNLIFTAGQTPKKGGKLVYKGKVGADVTPEQAYDAARICTLNNLGNIEALGGGVDNISRIVKVTVFVSSAPGFGGQAKVADGVTDLTAALFGENGIPARSAVGMAELPGDSPLEVEMVVAMKE